MGRTGCLLTLLGFATLLCGCRGEEVFPDRPILLVCPWSAGGGTDLVSRQVAAELEREIGVPVNVVNATGGAGVTGHTRGARARPDGYTITMITVELNMLHWRGLTSITHEDFRPLLMLNRDDAALFVRDDAPWKDLTELEQSIRDQPPRHWKASGTAQGGIWHVALAGWLDAIGLDAGRVNWISINGAGPSLQELLSGGVEMVCCSLPEASTQMQDGRVRCLGVMANDRIEGFPDVPTFREQGFDWSLGGWRGLAVPAETPDDRFQILVSSLQRVVEGDAYRRFMRSTGFNISIESPEEFRTSMESLDEQFGEILTSDAFRSVQTARYGPMLFPATLAGLLVLTVLAMLLRGELRRTDPDAGPLPRAGLVRAGLAVGWVVAYLLLAESLGFVLTAAGLLVLFLLALRVRWPLAVGVPVVLVPLMYQVFAVGLRVSLPWGWLGW
ncbi:hypothetical protein BH23PLA1_BH23PLA1_28550 [soil metagenome]